MRTQKQIPAIPTLPSRFSIDFRNRLPERTAFDLGSYGYVEPLELSNPNKMNLTAYAVGTESDLYVTVINKTHAGSHDAADAQVTIQASGFTAGRAVGIVLTDGEPGNASLMKATLGGALITNSAPWTGKWTPLGPVRNGRITLTVQSTTAVIVKIENAKTE